MNNEDVSTVLGRVVPEAPSPDAWAGAAVGRARRQRRAGVAAVAALALVAVPLGVLLAQKPPRNAVPAAPGGEVTGDVVILGPTAAPELCLGAMAASLPPQCGGPMLKGDFDWAQVEFDEAGGVRWTERTYTVRGLYDPDDGERGSFTLTAPVVAAPDPAPLAYDFPQLCDDPYADGGSPGGGGEAPDGGGVLADAAATLPLVAMWVSDGQSNFNVLVQGDADAAFRQLRTVWKGGLCVQSSSAPTEARRLQALDEVMAALPPGQLVYADGGGVNPELTVHVALVTPEVEAAVRGAAGEVPVTLTAVFTPVAGPLPSDPATPDGPGPTPSDPATTAPAIADPPTLVLGTALLQRAADGLTRLCLTVGYSHPAACGGPVLKGDLSWDEIPHDDVDGVLQSRQEYTVTGEYDPDDPSDPGFGAILRHEAPQPAGMPGVELERPSALCEGDAPLRRSDAPGLRVEDAPWLRVEAADGPDVPLSIPDLGGLACDSLTKDHGEARLDGVVESVRGLADGRSLGLSRDGNDILLRVVAADGKLVDGVANLVLETGVPVAIRTALTPPGEPDTTLIVPGR